MHRDELLGPPPPGQEGMSYTEANESTGYQGYAWGIGVFVVIALKAVVSLGSYHGDARTDVPPPQRIETVLRDLAREEQRNLPVDIDAETALTGIDATGRTITYTYDLSRNIPPAQLAAVRVVAYGEFRQRACADAAMRGRIIQGATIAYRYIDPEGAVVDGAVRSCDW